MDGFISMLPNYGDVVLHCGHLNGTPGLVNFHVMKEELPFMRPDGTEGIAKWAIVCNLCIEKWGPDAFQAITSDGKWGEL